MVNLHHGCDLSDIQTWARASHEAVSAAFLYWQLRPWMCFASKRAHGLGMSSHYRNAADHASCEALP